MTNLGCLDYGGAPIIEVQIREVTLYKGFLTTVVMSFRKVRETHTTIMTCNSHIRILDIDTEVYTRLPEVLGLNLL